MPVVASQARLAASPGHDAKRAMARRAVALEFFKEHIFGADAQSWPVVQRAMQCIDFARPVLVGPDPAPPRRLAALPPDGPLGAGFFGDAPSPKADRVDWYVVAPDAVYLKYFAPAVRGVSRVRTAPPARYFLPGARLTKGPSVVTKERA